MLSVAGVSILGGVVSSIIKSALVTMLLPQSSVAIKSTLTNPVAPHSSLNTPPLFVQVTTLQSSLASAPPLFANQPWYSDTLPEPSHSTVSFCAKTSSVGGVLSSIVKIADVCAVLPH